MIRVAVLTEDPGGPSARHRWAYAAGRLRDEGVEIALHAVEPRSERPAAFAAAGDADLAVVHRKLFRWPDLAALRRRNPRIVYDLDDAVMFRPSGRRRQRSFLRAWRFARTMRRSVLFLAGNRYLADRAPRRLPVVWRPTPVDTERHRPREDWPDRGRVLGWIGTAATLPYLRAALPALRDLAARRGDVLLRVIGPAPEGLSGLPVEHVPWTEEGEAGALASLDVGLLPLPDDPWTRGKCAFKALQYMAAGLPVVASPVGMSAEVVEDGTTGFLARSPKEWTARLDGVLDDPEVRERMGRAGRDRAVGRWSHDALTPPLARSLRSILG